MLRWFEHHQIYQPYRSMHETGASLGRAWEDVFFKTSDGVKLNGWFFPATRDSSHAKHVILFCHGNAGNISHRLDCYEVLLKAGVNVFAFDYRGYGRSSGRPSEVGTYRDAEAASLWLQQKGFKPRDIIVWGESLGGAVATELARNASAGAAVLQSTFTSIPDIGAEIFPWLPVRLISTIHYDSLGKIGGVRVPLLVMHSKSDSVVGVHHGERLFAAARDPKLFCSLSGDHNDSWNENATEYLDGLRRLLELLGRLEAVTLK